MGSLVERQFPRATFEAIVSGTGRFGRFFAAARDLGLGGICVETDYPFSVGERLELALPLPHGLAKIAGNVGWIEEVFGRGLRVGVCFEPLTHQAFTAIKKYVAAALSVSGHQRGSLSWPLLFSHFDLGPLRLRNRLVMAPMFWGYANGDGTVSQPLIDLYGEIARGGASMIVVANAIVSPEGSMSAHALRLDEDRFIPGLARLARAIKEAGCVACLQLNHAGRFAKAELPLAPSPVPLKNVASEMGFLGEDADGLGTSTRVNLIGSYVQHMVRCRRQMSPEEIEATVASFAAAARRAAEAGFQAVELHGATGYLLAQFLSGRTNHRQDGYGGSLEGRMRFPLEVVAAVRAAVGDELPVGYRFLADEFLPGGFGLEEARAFAARLERAGMAYLSVTGATYESMFLPHVVKFLRRPASLLPLAAEIKKAVGLPVIAAGRLGTPKLAEEALEANQADLIGLARGLFCDPEWPRKALEGRDKDIRQCRGCNQCLHSVIRDKPVICARWHARKRVSVALAVKGTRRWTDVLIAIDGSDASLSAVEYARRLLGGAGDEGRRLTLFHVKPAGARRGGQATVEELITQAKEILAGSGIPPECIAVKIVPETSGVAEGIIGELREGSYGLVVMGRRGLSQSRRLLFGSVSRTVLQQARDCAVCILD